LKLPARLVRDIRGYSFGTCFLRFSLRSSRWPPFGLPVPSSPHRRLAF